jgi:uncharacterized protein (DUF2252 family)
MSRDLVGEIVSNNRPVLEHNVPREGDRGEGDRADLTREALRRKMEAMASSSFLFFRGTFHLMAWDLFQHRVPEAKPAAPNGLIVGDLHLENFGVYRGQTGELCFDVNDFDDVGLGPLDLDLRRLCTSALLLPGLSNSVRTNAARSIALAWAEEVDRIGGRFPVPAWTVERADGPVRDLLRQGKGRSRGEMIAKIAPGKGHKRFGDPQKFARPAKPWVQLVEKAFAEYKQSLKRLKALKLPDDWAVLDVAYGFKGIGSLGRLRFSILAGKGEQRRVFELKEARPSVMEVARGLPPPRDRGRAQTASIRRLQGDPWPRVASTHLDRLSALGRENDPSEEKFSFERFAGGADHHQVSAYARQCGEVLARMHCRYNAPVMFDTTWIAADAAHRATAFAEKYAAQVDSDHRAFVQARSKVSQSLGL